MQTIGDSQVIKSGPRYQRAMKSIAESIALGRYAPGQKLPGLKELSRDLGMNYLTVRRALLELAEKGMVDIRHGVGTFVQERTNHTYEKCLKLALAIRSCMLNIDKNHPVVGAYLAGAYQCCQNKHCRVQSLVFDEGRFTEQLKRMITEESLDGIVVTTGGAMNENDFEFLEKNNVHVVECREYSANSSRLSVVIDKLVALRQAVEHLRLFGHKRIVFLYYVRVPREDTLKRCFAEIVLDNRLGDPEEMTVLIDNPTDQTHWEDVGKLFAMSPLPTAVIVSDEFIADKVLDYAQSKGILIPEQLSMVALQDCNPYGHRVPLTSFGGIKDFSRMIRTACDLLIRAVSGEQIENRHISFCPEITVKASSGPVLTN